MAVGQIMNGLGCHDMLAAQCKCAQCEQDLSAMSYERRVAHVKRCAEHARQKGHSKGHSQGSRTAGSADKPFLPGWEATSGADSGHLDSKAACIDPTIGVEGILAQLGMEAHIPAFLKEEVDIRALPELSDEDLIYLGVSDTWQRRKLLQVARALKRSAGQRLRGTQATATACQPAQIPAGSTVAQRTASATSVSRSGSHDSRISPQKSRDKAAAAAASPLACDIGSCKVMQQRSHTEGTDTAHAAGLLPAEEAFTESQRTLATIAGFKRSAGNDMAVVPQSSADANFAEQPGVHTRPPPRKFAKLSRSMLYSRKTDRPVTKAHTMATAHAAAKHHVTAGSSLRDAPSKEQSAVLQGTRKAHSMPRSDKTAQHHLHTGMGVQAAASQEHTSLAAHIPKAPGTEAMGSPPSLKHCYSLHPLLTAEMPARLEVRPVAGEPKQGTAPEDLPDCGRSSSAKDEPGPHRDEKPAAYLSGALGYLLATKSMRACISQNGSYSRQAELRLLQTLYPDEGEQHASSVNGHQHGRRGPDVWSSDDEETVAGEADPPPPLGCTIRGSGVQQVPKEASLWAMSRQDPQRECSVRTLQQRHAARKTARSGAMSTEAMQQDQKPLQACVSGPGKSATSMIVPQQSSATAGGFTAQQLDRDMQVLSSTTSHPAGDCAVQGPGVTSAGVCAGQTKKEALHRQTGVARDEANSNKALRVQSLRQELAAAEAVVIELKSWLADAEVELEEERLD